ncbi:FMN reductase [uncultured Bartonella sp.]|uniref:FMN reductase n=1 Tax=uncultured Bartonella sp. TaxID=104108 RepID=UPI0025D5AF5E|nr:FMN reductase [uncultured Bartonella sp.]
MSKVIVFSGSFNRPSKTTALVNYIGEKVAKKFGTKVVSYDLLDVGTTLGLAQRADKLEPKGQQIIEELTSADALVIGSPVYKGSYPGLFKHFIDLIEPERLYGKPVLLSATGGGDRHALMVEHQLRPLFGFFMAHSLPTAIYASSRDFGPDNEIRSQDLVSRIDKAVNQFAPFISAETAHSSEQKTTVQRARRTHDVLPFAVNS